MSGRSLPTLPAFCACKAFVLSIMSSNISIMAIVSSKQGQIVVL